jgi:anti-sigma factor ChrR (cupin superfamily)
MPRFAKQPDCPASITLRAYGAGTLSFLARPGLAAHLATCEYCGAELSLLTRAARCSVETSEVEPPPAPAMPLALRLLAQTALADITAAGVRAEEKRAA